MKVIHWFSILIVGLTNLSRGERALGESSTAHAAAAPHLDLGGVYYSFIDLEDDVTNLTKIVDSLVALGKTRNVQRPLPADFSFAKVWQAAGFADVQAFGMSSRRMEKGRYHNRAFLHLPKGPQGFLQLFARKSHDFRVATLAPADADFAAQFDLNLSTVLPTVERVLEAVGDQPTLGKLKFFANTAVPGLNLNVAQLMEKLDITAYLIARVDPQKKVAVPGGKLMVPIVHVAVALEGVDFLVDPLLTMAGESDATAIERTESATILRPTQSLPGALDEHFRPVVIHDRKQGLVMAASHLDFANEVLASTKPLRATDAFRTAMQDLPGEGNAMQYWRPQLIHTFIDAFREAFEADFVAKLSPEEAKAMAALREPLMAMFMGSTQPVGSVQAVVDGGIVGASNATTTHKMFLANAALIPPLLLGVAVPGVVKAVSRTIENVAPEAEEAPQPAGDTVRGNLQQIVFAAHAYFLDDVDAAEVTYDDLVKQDLMVALDPIAGEDYAGLTVKRVGGTLEVTDMNDNRTAIKYDGVTD
jgi:hypothetical protein